MAIADLQAAYPEPDAESPARKLDSASVLQILTDTEAEPDIRRDCRDELAARLRVGSIPPANQPLVFEALAAPIPTGERWEQGFYS